MTKEKSRYLNLPKTTNEAWTKVGAQGVSSKHPGLLFYRYLGEASSAAEEGEEKARIFQNIASSIEGVYGFFFEEALVKRTQALWTSWNSLSFQGTLVSRMVVGLGQKSPLEVGFRFHWLYGIPIIPGSALKGVARAYAELIERIFEKDETSQEDFFRIFGRPPKGTDEGGEAGNALFFDAIPTGKVQLDIDVMTPHYPKYYQGKEPPGNWQDPVPIPFLTVAPGTRFLFAVGWRKQKLTDEDRQLQKKAAEWLRLGLTMLGIGAKTTSGYGRFLFEEPPQWMTQQATTETQWRSGRIKEYRPDRKKGTLIDEETGRPFSFSWDAIEDKSWSPGKKNKVEFVLDESGKRVIRLRRKK